MAAAIPFAFDDCLELVDTPGRDIREDKRGYTLGETPRMLDLFSRAIRPGCCRQLACARPA